MKITTEEQVIRLAVSELVGRDCEIRVKGDRIFSSNGNEIKATDVLELIADKDFQKSCPQKIGEFPDDFDFNEIADVVSIECVMTRILMENSIVFSVNTVTGGIRQFKESTLAIISNYYHGDRCYNDPTTDELCEVIYTKADAIVRAFEIINSDIKNRDAQYDTPEEFVKMVIKKIVGKKIHVSNNHVILSDGSALTVKRVLKMITSHLSLIDEERGDLNEDQIAEFMKKVVDKELIKQQIDVILENDRKEKSLLSTLGCINAIRWELTEAEENITTKMLGKASKFPINEVLELNRMFSDIYLSARRASNECY